MIDLLPNIIPKIEQKTGELGLKKIESDIQEFIVKEKEFYSTIAQSENLEKVFFKTLIADQALAKERFLNEIGFLKTIKENPWHPLYKITPELLDCSLSPEFPYLFFKYPQGKIYSGKDRISPEDIRHLVRTIKTINSSATGVFNFIPAQPFFGFSYFADLSDNFFAKNPSPLALKTKINSFLNENRELFKKTKPSLSHGKFSETNAVFGKKEIIILGWEYVQLRNPLYDLADFWLGKKYKPEEQAVLMAEYLGQVSDKSSFRKLFQAALIEICLRDLDSLFGARKKEKTDELNKRIEEYEAILEKGIIG